MTQEPAVTLILQLFLVFCVRRGQDAHLITQVSKEAVKSLPLSMHFT